MKGREDLSPWLAGVYVKKHMRRAGRAKDLIERIEQIARAESVKRIYLYTEHQQQYYEKLGWVLMEKCLYHETDVAIMMKNP